MDWHQWTVLFWWCLLWGWPLLGLLSGDIRQDKHLKNAILTISGIGIVPALEAFLVVWVATAIGFVR